MKREGKILHLLGWDQKFVPSFIAFVQENFPAEDHHFIIHGAVPDGRLPIGVNITHRQNVLKNMLSLLGEIRRARKVILHGLFSSHLYYALALQPSMLKKCYWVIWGGDLYIHTADVSDWRHRKNEWFRRFVISRLGHLVTYIKGDYELAKQWYGASGEYHECLMYLSNVIDPQVLEMMTVPEHRSALNILVGNSADPSNNHLMILEKILPYKDKNIRIYVPLSYGDRGDAQKIINQGQQWFGEKFIPIKTFMPFTQYLHFLKCMDVAIFNHDRQQAMGITITLIAMGKIIYMRSDVTQWEFLRGLGIYLKDVSELDVQEMTSTLNGPNSEIARSYFTQSNLISQLKKFL